MGKTATNITIILGLITLVYGGYYAYTQFMTSSPNFDTNEQTMENMLRNTQQFIEHETVLNQVDLNIEILEDPRFLSLQSYTTPIQESEIGKPDPFAEVSGLNAEQGDDQQ